MRRAVRVPVSLLIYVCALTAAEHPLYFEQRGDLFQTRTENCAIELGTDQFRLDDVHIRFLGASAGAKLQGVGTPAPATYFTSTGTVRLRQFSKVRSTGVYPGVDVLFYGDGARFEYDLVLAPGADARAIKLRVEGGHPARIDGEGNLIVEAAAGEIRQMAPRVFEERGGQRREIAARYKLRGNEITFETGPRDPQAKLTIDPVVVYRKYFGGSAFDYGGPVATDASGNVYVTGSSSSIDFPTTSGTSLRPSPPLLAFSNGGQSIARVPVGTQVTVNAIGGSPDGSVLYAATPNGVFVSGDHGATFTKTASISATAPFAQSFTVQAIAVDQIDPARVWLGTNAGLFETDEAGQFWGQGGQGLPLAGNLSTSITALLISPADHTVSFALVGNINASTLCRTTNAGGSWQELSPAYPGEPAAPQFSGTNLSMALTADGKTLYVVDNNAILLQSDDNGTTWKQHAGQLFGATSITIDAATGTIYVVDLAGLQRSTDGGNTFKTISPALQQGEHVSAFAEDGSGALYISTSQSEFEVSRDNGATWAGLPLRTFIHQLAAFGGQVYTAVDSSPVSFVTKWSADGSKLLYSTFFGGTYSDRLAGIQVNAQGEAVIGGTTSSQDFPVTKAIASASPVAFSQGFVAKLSADGSQLVYATTLGASKNVNVNGIAIDSTGAPYITGYTGAPDFPTTATSFQPTAPGATCQRPDPGDFLQSSNLGVFGFVSKLNPDGSGLTYSTFLTAACGSLGEGIAVNAAGEAVVVGYTTSLDFPVSAGAYETSFPPASNPADFGFVSRLSAAGDKLVAGTLVGGGLHTEPYAVTLDGAGNPYLAGYTWGIAPGATAGAYQTKITDTCGIVPVGPSPPEGGGDAFVLKLDPTLSTAKFLTYLGGVCDDSATSIALTRNGNVWVSGNTSVVSNFPLVTPFAFYSNSSSYFVSELSPDASQLLYSTMADGSNIAADTVGAVYISGQGRGFTGPGTASLTKLDPGTAPPVVIASLGAAPGFQLVPRSSQPSIGTVAPGELIAITGQHLGPATTLNAQLDSAGRLPFTLGATTVYFNDNIAPLISVQDGLVVCSAPFELSGLTQLTVKVDGQSSEAVRVNSSGSAPYILSITNQDGTANGPNHPAPPGSVVGLYLTGFGATTPLSQDGSVTGLPFPALSVPVTANVGGRTAVVQYAGAAPGLLAGISQVNVAIPAGPYPTTPPSIIVNSAIAPLYIAQ